MKQLSLFLLLLLTLSGCATVNPSDISARVNTYRADLDVIWNDAISRLPLSGNYSYIYLVAMNKLPDTQLIPDGIPRIIPNHYTSATNDFIVGMPEDFIKYVYKYFYNERIQIFTCLFSHEIAHIEFNLASEPPETHYLVDKKAIDNFLSSIPLSSNEYYSFLRVVHYYWGSRHALDSISRIMVNTISLASVVYGGPGVFFDPITTDINTRLNLLKKDYPDSKFVYKRSKKEQ